MVKKERYIRNGLIGAVGICGTAFVGGLIDHHYNVELPREAEIKVAYNEVITSLAPPSSEAIADAKALIDIKQQCDSGANPIIVWRNNDLLGSCNIIADQVQIARNIMDQQDRFDKEFARARNRHFADSSKKNGIVYVDRARIDGVISIGSYIIMLASAVGIGLMTHRRSL